MKKTVGMKHEKRSEQILSNRPQKRIFSPSPSITKKTLVKNNSYKSSSTQRYILTYKFLAQTKNQNNSCEKSIVVVSKNHSIEQDNKQLLNSQIKLLYNKIEKIEKKLRKLQEDIKQNSIETSSLSINSKVYNIRQIKPEPETKKSVTRVSSCKKIILSKNNSYCFHKIKNLVYKSKSPIKMKNSPKEKKCENYTESIVALKSRCYNILGRYLSLIKSLQSPKEIHE